MFTQHVMFRTLTATTVAAAFAVSGCSSSKPPARPPSTPSLASTAAPPAAVSTAQAAAPTLPDPCSLLTKAEAEQLAGVTMQPGDDTVARDPATDVGSCTYDAAVTGPSGSVNVFDQLGVPHAMEVDRAIHHKFRSVAGIGDEALEEPENQSIFIRKGQMWIYVEASNSTPASLEKAARLIAGRLK